MVEILPFIVSMLPRSFAAWLSISCACAVISDFLSSISDRLSFISAMESSSLPSSSFILSRPVSMPCSASASSCGLIWP